MGFVNPHMGLLNQNQILVYYGALIGLEKSSWSGRCYAMQYRVIEDLEAPDAERFVVQYDRYGDHWRTKGRFPDQVSAEIFMERLAAGPLVVAQMEGLDFK